jgi:hypothetical protein
MTNIERNALVLGIIGLVLFIIGLVVEPRQALTSYLFAYATVSTIVLGALIQVMMSYVSGARWFTVLRRLALDVTGALPALVLLALPLFVGVLAIYSWATPSALPPEARAIVERKSAWLNVPFFVGRGVVYLAVWLAVGITLRRWSLRQDVLRGEASAAAWRRLRRLSAGGLVAIGLTLTFASFDWLMSLDPTWYSTIYGVYVFAGGFLAALGLIAILAYKGSTPAAVLERAITREQVGALGKLVLTFVVFWAYIAFSQFLIIWIGDVPLDASWYVTRAAGSWGTLALVIVAGQFALPFVVLLPRELKRRPRVMAALGWLLLAMHVLDMYWLVLPALHPQRVTPSWLDAAALLTVSGFATAAAAWRSRGREWLPLGDPYLTVAMRYVEP